MDAGANASKAATSQLVAARNRDAIGLIPSCVFSSYDCRRAGAGALRPQRDDAPVELCRGTDSGGIPVGDLERAQSVALGVSAGRDQQLRSRAATGVNCGEIAAPLRAAHELIGHAIHKMQRAIDGGER